jgi:hypothetical protein
VTLAAVTSLTIYAACNIQDEENQTPDDEDGSSAASSTTGGTGATTGASSGTSSGAGGSGTGTGGGDSGGTGGLGNPPGVQCGADTCDVATEVCCVHADAATCELPADCVDEPNNPVTAKLSCDDSQDCDGGICCLGLDPTGVELYECKPADTTCGEHEVCIPGERTCQPTYECVLGPGYTGGQCASTTAEVPCGGNLTCKNATPVCCWDATTTTGTCVTHGSDCETSLACDAPSDCGPGYTCCTNNTTATCTGTCPFTAACEQTTDCPTGTCTPAPTLPAGFSTCQ